MKLCTLETQCHVIRYVETLVQQAFPQIGGTVHLGMGQEPIDVAVCNAFPSAMFFGNHRSHGQYLAATGDYGGLFRQLKEGNSQHLKADNFLSNGVQGSLMPVALGCTYGKHGKDAVVFVGDGTLAQGVFWETLAMATLANVSSHRLVIVVIDNRYSMSATQPIPSCFGTAQTFGCDYALAWEPEPTTLRDLCLTNEGTRPLIVAYTCHRLCGHSCNDTQMYRPKEERTLAWFKANDPLEKFVPDQAQLAAEKEAVDAAFDKYFTRPH